MNQTETTTDDDNNNSKPAETESTTTAPEWITETINGGSFCHVDLETGTNGWASPPGNVFSLRSHNYFTATKQKSPGGDYLLSLAAVDWLKSTTKKLDHILSRPDNRVIHAFKTSQSRSFIFAVNFQVPGKEHYNLVSTSQHKNQSLQIHSSTNSSIQTKIHFATRGSKSLAML